MGIAFRQRSEVVGTGANPTPTEPTGTIQGDVLYSLFLVKASGGTASLPAGWTQLDSGSNASFTWKIGRVVRGSSAPSYAFTMAAPPDYREVFVVSISGADTNVPESAATYGTSASATTPDPPAVTPSHNDCLILAGGSNWNGAAAGYVAPTNYTIRTSNASGNDGVFITRVLAAGLGISENPGAITGATTAQTHAFSIAVKPLGSIVARSRSLRATMARR